jgi:hypothetical protein
MPEKDEKKGFSPFFNELTGFFQKKTLSCPAIFPNFDTSSTCKVQG